MRKHVGLKSGTIRKKLLRMVALGLCSAMLVCNFSGGAMAVSNAAETADGSSATQTGETVGEVETIKLTTKNTVMNFNPEGFTEIEGCVHDKVYYTAEDNGAYTKGYYFLIKSSAHKMAYKFSFPFTGDSLRFEYGLTNTKNGVKVSTKYYSLLKVNEAGQPYVAEHGKIQDPAATPTPVPDTTKEQKLTVDVKSKKYKGDSLKKSKKSFDIGASAMTDISYKVLNGSKYISVNADGVVTVKKNTPKGTYKIRVVAEATEEYEEAETIVTVTVTKKTAPDFSLRWSDFKTTGKYGFNFKKESKNEDSFYTYVSTIGEKKKDYKKLLKTKRGICLGSAKSAVVKEYGEDGIVKYKYKQDDFYSTIKKSDAKTVNLLKKIKKVAKYTTNKFRLDHPGRIPSTIARGDTFEIRFYFGKNDKVELIVFCRR